LFRVKPFATLPRRLETAHLDLPLFGTTEVAPFPKTDTKLRLHRLLKNPRFVSGHAFTGCGKTLVLGGAALFSAAVNALESVKALAAEVTESGFSAALFRRAASDRNAFRRWQSSLT
jgi:hypothetical protein